LNENVYLFIRNSFILKSHREAAIGAGLKAGEAVDLMRAYKQCSAPASRQKTRKHVFGKHYMAVGQARLGVTGQHGKG
jgi:hypothetical protein